MKANNHALFVIPVVLALVLVIRLIKGSSALGLGISFIGVSLILVVRFILMRNQNLAELNLAAGNPVELQRTNVRSGAEYKFNGIYRRGELRLVDESLIFESAGLDDFGPFYKFHNRDIDKIKSGSSSFMNGEELILVLRNGSQENFRVKSVHYWLSALSSWGKNEQAIP
ncbi:MAG: hypothetical protein ACKVOK_06045 [Flavobacteriales bacterium]